MGLGFCNKVKHIPKLDQDTAQAFNLRRARKNGPVWPEFVLAALSNLEPPAERPKGSISLKISDWVLVSSAIGSP